MFISLGLFVCCIELFCILMVREVVGYRCCLFAYVLFI